MSDAVDRLLLRDLQGPPSTRADALGALGRYARLAAFAALCAVYVLVRYVLLPRRTRTLRGPKPARGLGSETRLSKSTPRPRPPSRRR